MPTTVISTNTSTPLTITSGDEYLLLPGVSHYSTSGATVNLDPSATSRSNFYIYGSLFATANDALNLEANAAIGGQVVVGTEGSVTGPSSHRGMDIRVSGTTISNLGEVSGSIGIDVHFSADDVRIYNAGTIFQSAGVSFLPAIRGRGENLSVVNDGLIFGRTGVSIDDGVVVNSGTLQGDDIAVEGDGSSVETLEVVNSGLIQSSLDAINVQFSTLTLRNTGEVQGDILAIGSASTILNLGTIQGEISLSASGDLVRNGGVIDGDVLLGSGADTYKGTGNGLVTGQVDGGVGSDTLIGGDLGDNLLGGADNDTLIGHGGDDTLDGGAGNDMMLGGDGNDSMTGGNNNDTLNGNSGDDTLEGGAGNDILVGQDGSDLLDGGALDDILDGGNGDDVLEGGSGNDILRGRAGEDNLAGGLGLDLLTGGQDADNFVFRSIGETVVGASRDQILDFEQGVDLIVVAGLHPGVFEFRGTAAFAPSGNPELRLFETPTSSTIVQLDTNGDGTQDAEIRVANVTGLTAEDFVL